MAAGPRAGYGLRRNALSWGQSRWRRRWWGAGAPAPALALALALALGSCTTGAPASSPAPSSPGPPGGASSSVPSSPTVFGDGTWHVGTQIDPGTYRTSGAHGLSSTTFGRTPCHWERDAAVGPAERALGSDAVLGPDIVTVLPTDSLFVSQGCGTWSPLPASGPAADTVGNGVFAVGVDISPGTYSTTGTRGVLGEEGGSVCVWERLGAFIGDSASVLQSGGPSGPATVTIEPSDRGFESQGCQEWRRS